jgi:hypothetical protein
MGGCQPPTKGDPSLHLVLQLDWDSEMIFDCDTTGSCLPCICLFCLLAMRDKYRGELKPTYYYDVRVLQVHITLWCPLGDDLAITRWARCQLAADNHNSIIALWVDLRDLNIRVFFIKVSAFFGNVPVFFRRVQMSASGMCGGGDRNFDGLNKCIQHQELEGY